MLETDETCARAPALETVEHEGKILCLIIRAEPAPDATTFYTPESFNLQVGKVVYERNTEIPRHTHRPVRRAVTGTSEVIIVQKGVVMVDIYDDDRVHIASRVLRPGDIVALVAGGHGFQVTEDTILVEVKQGPYSGLQEKDRF